MSKNAMALANIETIIVGNASGISKTLKLSGKISTNDKTGAVQTAHFGGRIEKLNFKTVGEYVSKGALIASIYSPELVTAQNELIEAISIKESQPELYKAVRNKLKYWKISEKQIQDIEYNKTVQSNFNMFANVSGHISEIFIEEGNHVNEGAPLFNVSNLEYSHYFNIAL
jgi:Cu(I)/Ag(I) efflux system membrane fusion protein